VNNDRLRIRRLTAENSTLKKEIDRLREKVRVLGGEHEAPTSEVGYAGGAAAGEEGIGEADGLCGTGDEEDQGEGDAEEVLEDLET
jgi:hypothetical protein